jgi:hypothetical protein
LYRGLSFASYVFGGRGCTLSVAATPQQQNVEHRGEQLTTQLLPKKECAAFDDNDLLITGLEGSRRLRLPDMTLGT